MLTEISTNKVPYLDLVTTQKRIEKNGTTSQSSMEESNINGIMVFLYRNYSPSQVFDFAQILASC